MSQDEGLKPYYQSGETGVEHRNIDQSGEDHPFGDEPKEWEADLRPLIRQVADDLYESWEQTVREYLANAETACLKVERFLENPEDSPFDDMIVEEGYRGAIEVVWNKQEQSLVIEDNGIGMAAVEVDQVFRHIGRSAARDLGAMSGAFGMGALSFLKFIGPENMMVMLSHSRLNDDNSAYLVTLAGVEPVRGSMDENQYGTKFKLDQRDRDMDIRPAVKKYAEWMRVPVMYRELDENGEEVFNEDWGDKRLFDDYSDSKYADWLMVDGCYEAYMSSEASNETLLLSMPIDRNSGHNAEASYPIDVRILDESGKVAHSTNGNEGLIPISRMEYEKMLLDARPDHITEPLLSNQDVTGYLTATGHDYAIPEGLLKSEEPLPQANYIALEELDSEDVGDRVVILGPHEGRQLVSDERWDELPAGRASQFVPEDELEEFDLKTEEGDLCLPKPTTDRSSIQSHDTFWKYLSNKFDERYDEKIDEAREYLHRNGLDITAVEEMNPQNVADLRAEVGR